MAPIVEKSAPLGVLSVHFEGGRCRVRCPFCYLGRRSGAMDSDGESSSRLDVELVLEALEALNYRELAVTLSEPIETVLDPLYRLLQAATARGRLVAVTTTFEILDKLLRRRSSLGEPAVQDALAWAGRLNLSVDPWKGQVSPALASAGRVVVDDIAALLLRTRASFSAERVLIVTLSSLRFAEELLGDGENGLLAALLELPDVDRVALNALKPPPPWCDRAFWLRSLARLAPLLRKYLDRKLFLDCYVAARILGLGGCPARPDLSPAPAASGVAFRSCVYQAAPDFVAQSGAELHRRLHDFTVPAACPFPID
jgi:hypothetical protein